MNLKRYLFEKQIKTNVFAKLIGFSKTYISLITNDRWYPGRKFIETVDEATGGLVKEKDYNLKIKKTPKRAKKKDHDENIDA